MLYTIFIIIFVEILLTNNSYIVRHLFLARFQSGCRLNYVTYAENVLIKINFNLFKYYILSIINC